MEKLPDRCFCCFTAAMLVPLGRAPTWRFHTKLYKFGWNTFPNNARMKNCTELNLARCFMYDSSITSKIPGLIHWMVMIFIFDCVILQTSHRHLKVPSFRIRQRSKFVSRDSCPVSYRIINQYGGTTATTRQICRHSCALYGASSEHILLQRTLQRSPGYYIESSYLHRMWKGEFGLNTLRVDGEIFESGKKKLRIQKYPDTCGRGLTKPRRQVADNGNFANQKV